MALDKSNILDGLNMEKDAFGNEIVVEYDEFTIIRTPGGKLQIIDEIGTSQIKLTNVVISDDYTEDELLMWEGEYDITGEFESSDDEGARYYGYFSYI